MLGWILFALGILVAGGSWEMRNYLRRRQPFPTRLTAALEIIGPILGLLLIIGAWVLILVSG